ncbi:MAG: asparagine synthase (glutamine-hydrolyzing) [Hyphomonadaceae bacterium]|nr:asparagine synthase (glutamine-hydrolyzing) [Hyphomonadaceae bacterium]
MCGIAGLMMRGGKAPPQHALDELCAAMAHRGPDANGQYVKDAVGLLSTRLAIMDVAGGDQPLYGALGAAEGTALVANGEIYNAPEIVAARPNIPYRTHSDCEPIAHLYEEKGLDFVDDLRGMYGAAIYDPGKKRLIVSRDEFGIKPLYYVETGDYFAFASEPQALVQAGLAERTLDAEAAGELLQLKYTTGRRCLFAGVERFLPGETIVVEDGRIVERRRIDAVKAPTKMASSWSRALTEFERVLVDSVRVHLRSDVPYTLYLSGGIDSSILLALMKRATDAEISALTIGYEGDHPSDESWHALNVAKAVGAECTRIEMSQRDFWRHAPRIVAALDDLTSDMAAIPTAFLAKETQRQGIKVALSGEGADELFGGYGRYRKAWLSSFFKRGDYMKRGVFDETELQGDPFGAWRGGIDAAHREEAAKRRSPAFARQMVDFAEWLPNDILVKLDRCLMAFGVEGRTPFLDREVVKFALTLPDRFKFGPTRGKWLLRHWLKRALPEAQPFLKKKGFKPPTGHWMADAKLPDLVAAQPGIAARFEAGDVRGIMSKSQENAQRAWSLLSYALWHSVHMTGVDANQPIDEVLSQSARMRDGAPTTRLAATA